MRDMQRMRTLFAKVSQDGYSSAAQIRNRLLASGLRADDPRLRSTMDGLANCGDHRLDVEQFASLVGAELLLVSKAIEARLVIPEWQEFCQDMETIHQLVAGNQDGRNADYIPLLRDADPDRWGVSICSVDGQRLDLGDVDCYHSIQSVSKPLSYAYALAREGEELTHAHVGSEPSGRPFNALDLLPDGRPFNACVNAGAIIIAGLVASSHPDRSARQVTQELMDLWSQLCGNCGEVRFNDQMMRSERDCADNNFALAFLMRSNRGLPRDVDLHTMLDVYFSCCSIEMTASMLAVAAACLANGGVCPISGAQVLSTEVVKKTLSLMQSAGMYDNAGSFTLHVGLPAKSGVAGTVLVVVPNLMGLATFSPRLDAFGNSVRGVAFCHELVERFNVHAYDCLSGGRSGCKRDPRSSQVLQKQRDLSELRWAVAFGDRHATRVRDLVLACMVDITLADGSIEASELAVIADTHAALLGHRPEPAQLSSAVDERQRLVDAGLSPFAQLLEDLQRQVTQLDDNSRELILEAAFRVACADGTVENQERLRLEAIAQALEIHPGVLDLEIARFQRHLS